MGSNRNSLSRIRREDLLIDNNGVDSINPDSKEILETIFTNIDKNVYIIRDSLSPTIAAAAMARLSRSYDDLRVVVVKEFFDSLDLSPTDVDNKARGDQEEKLLARVISEYGDDSVQQLGVIYGAVEGASNLLTKELEWGRLAAYLEQSTRYVPYDKKDSNNSYKYVVPEEIQSDPSAVDFYRESIDRIFDNYSTIVKEAAKRIRQETALDDNASEIRKRAWLSSTRAQACDLARQLLPAASKSNLGFVMSAQSLEYLVMRLRGSLLLESKTTGEAILEEARKVAPVFFQRADLANRGGAITDYRVANRRRLKQIADALLGDKQTTDKDCQPEARLVDYNYPNELDICGDMIYDQSSLSLAEINQSVLELSDQDKIEIIKAYCGQRGNRRHKPGRALEKIHYSWDIISDYGIFRDLQRHRMVDDFQWQQLTTNLGYRIPTGIEKYGLDELYQECFSISDELYHYLANNFNKSLAQYAVLLGYNMRWKMTYNARQAFHMHELRTTDHCHPGYRRLVQGMHSTISRIHPNIAGCMSYVGQKETPELGRMSSEYRKQQRLEETKIAETDS